MKDEKEIIKQAKKVAARFGRNYDERQDIEGRCIEIAWKAQPKLDENLDPKNYIIKSMENVAKSYLRSIKSFNNLQLIEEANEIFPDGEYESMVIQTEMKEKLEGLINSLEHPDNKIVTFLAKGMSADDIATELKMTVGSVRTRMSRGRKKWEEVFNSV